MIRYILYRLAAALPVLFGVTLLVFFMVRLVPGDPVEVMYGDRATPETSARLRQALGLDRPIYEQYAIFLADAVRGDLGESIRSKQPVVEEIRLRLPNTLKLTFASLIITAAVGVGLGVLSAANKGSWVDLGSMLTAIVSVSVPSFWMGLMFILVFSVRFGWFPVAGADNWRYLVLPAFTLGIRSAAVLARMTRSTMLDVLSQDYIRTARAKGLRERVVVYRHALRNALIPIVTVLGFELGYLLTGTFIIESVFAYPGIGMLAIQSLSARDFPLIQGIVLFVAVIYLVINLIVDVLYGFLDPRVRYA
jgi:peptide/nickel transport system permease protein/oligopeptide transport system permease protein